MNLTSGSIESILIFLSLAKSVVAVSLNLRFFSRDSSCTSSGGISGLSIGLEICFWTIHRVKIQKKITKVHKN